MLVSTHQTSCNVGLTAAGARSSYNQVTTYRSTADVIDEVRVILPLTLSTDSVGLGGMAFALTTTYGSRGTTVQTFDANGNPTELIQRFGTAVSTTTTRITSTGTVCK